MGCIHSRDGRRVAADGGGRRGTAGRCRAPGRLREFVVVDDHDRSVGHDDHRPGSGGASSKLDALTGNVKAAQKSTFQAVYTSTSGGSTSTITLAQSPPKQLFSSTDSSGSTTSLVNTGTTTYSCTGGSGGHGHLHVDRWRPGRLGAHQPDQRLQRERRPHRAQGRGSRPSPPTWPASP